MFFLGSSYNTSCFVWLYLPRNFWKVRIGGIGAAKRFATRLYIDPRGMKLVLESFNRPVPQI